jgi:transposase
MSQGRTHRRYTRDFKSQAVELSSQPGMTVQQAASDLGVPLNALYRWRKEWKEQGADAFRGHGNRTAAEAELFRLRQENAKLKMYVDILKKATAFFAENPR